MSHLMAREEYYQYFGEVKFRGYVIDDYDDNTTIEELEEIYKYIAYKLAEKSAKINNILRDKDFRRNKI